VAEPRFEIGEDMLPIFGDFMGEAPVLLAAMEQCLLAVSASHGQGSLDPLLRSLHTLKGIFGFLGLEAMHRLCHDTESALQPFASGAALGRGEIQVALAACDLIRAQVDEISRGLHGGSFEILGASASQPQASEESPGTPSHESFIRVRMEKMNSLFELVGEMAICQAQVGEGLERQELPPALHSEVGRLGKIARELQKSVQALRLVPAEPLFLRAGRLAHDLSLKTGKALDFDAEGRDTELDKGLVEELAEPLLHLIRNAVDHGLESAAERLAQGKPERGRLTLRASHQAGDFVLELEDDGRGIDLAKVAQRGLAQGRLAPGEEKDRARLERLIFEPGFSTASEVSDLSGRGVGLDAVRSRILSMKGALSLRTEAGKGCVFSIRLPLTMALVEGIMVGLGGERYVVPASMIRKFVALDTCSRHDVQGRAWIDTGGESLPLISADGLGTGALPERGIALHVECLGRNAALIVDEVLGKQQVVAKGLEGQLKGLSGLSGGAILADGRVSLILDLEALMGKL
jgi:two-component system chemotaxis sensor kinase CheA